MLPGLSDESHAQPIADKINQGQDKHVRRWARELREWFRGVERNVLAAMNDDSRSEAILRQAPEEDWIEQILGRARIWNSIEVGLREIYESNSRAIAEDIAETVDVEFGTSYGLPDHTARSVIREGGRRLGLLDMAEQAKREMFRELLLGRQQGQTGRELAERIVDKIGKGRFRDVRTRALTIARTETNHAQRYSSLQLYRDNPTITGIKVFDGQYGSPRSDAVCIARNGDIVSFDEAQRLMDTEHPNGTLVLGPVAVSPRG